jgi:flagellar hook-basal body complex protein FliE
MAIDPATASAAYQAVGRMATPGGADALAAGADASGQNFASALQDAVKNAVGTMRAGESAAADAAAGKGDIVQVVNSVTAAELTLQTVVAIRDRVISAYQDIMKMPI